MTRKKTQPRRKPAEAGASGPTDATVPTDWSYEQAVERGRLEARHYLEATHTLLGELRAAREALPVTVPPGSRDPSFDAFCSEIGISPVVATRWLQGRSHHGRSAEGTPDRIAVTDAIDGQTAPGIIEKLLAAIEARNVSGGLAAEVMTLAESAQFLRCDEAFLRGKLTDHDLPFYSLDGEPRMLKADLLAWLRFQQALPSSPAPNVPTVRTTGTPACRAPMTRPTGSRPRRGKSGRASWCSTEEQARIKQVILDELGRGAAITDAARTAGIAWATLTKWRRADAEFASAVEARRKSARQN